MSVSSPTETYRLFLEHHREMELLNSCGSVLGWDEQVNMPPQGAEHRAKQVGLIAGLVHDRATDPRLREWLRELEASPLVADPQSDSAVNVREARRDYDRATKFTREFVEELSRICSLGQKAWVEARAKKEFSHFLPWLEKIVSLKREEARIIGYGDGVPYDALLDTYEPGVTTRHVQGWFEPLRKDLVKLLQDIQGSAKKPRTSILETAFPIDQQRSFCRHAASLIGFDFSAGRLDEAAHPFCSEVGPGDVRLTTRYDFHHFPGAFFGTLHEAGHGIYEQGLPKVEAVGTPLAHAVSLGIHESQSRFWENFIGRSRAYWEYMLPQAKAVFPASLGGVALDEFLLAVNSVQPSFIRVEADEVTYNLHIMLRFELEQKLISGELEPRDVREVWNANFTRDFGITPPDDAQGCLQDIHWSFGGIGYFPTYTLGNMCAAQFHGAICRDLGDLPGIVRRGEFPVIKDWLNEKIHRLGKRDHCRKLVESVSGEALSHRPLVQHLRGKFGELYGF